MLSSGSVRRGSWLVANTPVRTLRVTDEVWAQVLMLAVSRETSTGEIVREAIDQYLERETNG